MDDMPEALSSIPPHTKTNTNNNGVLGNRESDHVMEMEMIEENAFQMALMDHLGFESRTLL